MKRATFITRSTASAPGRMLLLLAVAWLNMAMAPCAMAFGDDQGCPHNSAGEHAGASSHQGHHQQPGQADCAGAGCCEAQEAASDARTYKSDDGNSSLLCAAPASTADITTAANTPIRPDTGRPSRCSTSPPIHLLNCVFLD